MSALDHVRLIIARERIVAFWRELKTQSIVAADFPAWKQVGYEIVAVDPEDQVTLGRASGSRGGAVTEEAVMTPRLCIKGCGRIANRPVRPQKHWRCSYCQPCWQRLASNRRAQWASLNQRRRAKRAEANKRMLRIGDRCVGYAKTVEHARAINAHIQRRVREFKSRLKARAEAEGAAAGAVPAQAELRAD